MIRATSLPRAAALIESPVGRLCIEADAEAVRAVQFVKSGAQYQCDADGASTPAQRLVERAAKELAEYFAGKRRRFDVPVAPRGTPFQERVWNALREIPFGTTKSYGEVARAIGRPSAARAVGSANHENPVAVIVPCHRVIGANRALVGYGGGLDKKEWLLAHEQKQSAVVRAANRR